MQSGALALLAGLALLLPGMAAALDYRSAGETAVLYDAPSQKAKPLFVIAAGTPVEAIVTLDAWVKVRDMKGDLAWIERRQLADRRTVQVRGETAQIHAEPSESATVVFAAEPDVLFDYVAPANTGWIKVRHRGGQQGFVKTSRIWGH
ncbi:MAG: SH3 domain-containing protein [Rhodocyclaceae bacterium]|nr:SH3 domain-containing protein [Rhodocyclaceae bacterium]MDZ4215471.1 SH3 domain-containing protein [Rhodocyclaceae bacterium]